MDARFGRVRDADVERRRDAHHHHHNRLLRHRASTSTRRRARWEGVERSDAVVGAIRRGVRVRLVGLGEWVATGRGRGARRTAARSGGEARVDASCERTTEGDDDGGWNATRERESGGGDGDARGGGVGGVEEGTRGEGARVAATERTARDAARARRDASSTIGTRGSVSVDDPRARGVVFPPNVVAADDDVGGERRREDEETPTRDADDADEETPIGPIEDELRAIRESSKPTTSSSADDRAPTLAIDPTRVRTISLNSPRAYVYEGFLTEEECDHMLELSRGRMTKSGVVDIATGGSTTSDIRTSTGTFISRKRDDVIARIEKRIELWSHVPETHGEPFQVLRYQHGQEYKAHFDYFFHKSGMRNNRIATVLLYLSDVEEGGETVFPNTDAPTNRDASKFSECGNLGRGIKARKGDALLFWSMKPGGELDPGSSHAGCPVIKGEKWTATKWMHVNPLGAPGEDVHKIFYDGGPLPTPGCNDANEACAGWAQSGECDKNPGFMHKSCTMSCRLCRGHWRDGGYEKPSVTASPTTNEN